MKSSAIVAIISACLVWDAVPCRAESPWATGSSLASVIGYDLQAHDANHKLAGDQMTSVCLLLGYFRGFAESAALAAHYEPTALPFDLPDSITNDEIERAVYKYLMDHSDKLDLKGDALVVAALSRAFPNTLFKPPVGAKPDAGLAAPKGTP